MLRRSMAVLVTVVVIGALTSTSVAATARAVPRAKPPKACTRYLAAVQQAGEKVADAMLVVGDGLLKVADAQLAGLSDDQAAVRKALADFEAIREEHDTSATRADRAVAKATAAAKACASTREKKALSRACATAVARGERFLQNLVEGHAAGWGAATASIDAAKAALAGDSAAEEQANAEAERLGARSTELAQEIVVLKRRFSRAATTCRG